MLILKILYCVKTAVGSIDSEVYIMVCVYYCEGIEGTQPQCQFRSDACTGWTKWLWEEYCYSIATTIL